MKMNKSILAALGVAGITLSLFIPAHAEENAGSGESRVNETQALMNAKISIADAIRAAELEGKGKAVDSGLNDENGVVSYQVEVVAQDGTRTDVFVDLQTGKVLKIAAADSGDGEQLVENGGVNEGGENGDVEITN